MIISDNLLNAAAVSFGPTIAVTVGAFINWRAGERAIDAAVKAQRATEKAAMDALRAQESTSVAAANAADAARALVVAAHASNEKLASIAEVGAATHTIVNNQRTLMIEKIERLEELLREAGDRIRLLTERK